MSSVVLLLLITSFLVDAGRIYFINHKVGKGVHQFKHTLPGSSRIQVAFIAPSNETYNQIKFQLGHLTNGTDYDLKDVSKIDIPPVIPKTEMFYSFNSLPEQITEYNLRVEIHEEEIHTLQLGTEYTIPQTLTKNYIVHLRLQNNLFSYYTFDNEGTRYPVKVNIRVNNSLLSIPQQEFMPFYKKIH
ncbi:hypothetical protein AKO1_005544 [Acrasis kona]|uniref:Dolichyl-diphosphooligosaccharide--protein glycosyltransferase subunit 1 n=1 Tax=Acrasis kona TaxID=1008807 RepID=A0AAW2YKV0_9EUKA